MKQNHEEKSKEKGIEKNEQIVYNGETETKMKPAKRERERKK